MNQYKDTIMMKQTVGIDRTGNRMAGDIKTVIADREELLEAAADVSGEGCAERRVSPAGD